MKKILEFLQKHNLALAFGLIGTLLLVSVSVAISNRGLIKGKLLGYDGNLITAAITEISDDTSPQLGGNLDAQTYGITAVGSIVPTGNGSSNLGAFGNSFANIYASGTAFISEVVIDQITTSTRIELDSAGTQDYAMFGRSGNAGFHIQGQLADTTSLYKFMTATGDGTDTNLLQIYGKGSMADWTNLEYINLGFSNTNSQNELSSKNGGTGTLLPLRIYTGTDTNQFSIETDGSIDVQGIQAFDAGGRKVISQSIGADHDIGGTVIYTINAGETSSQGDLLFLHTDGELWIADADSTVSSTSLLVWAAEGGSDGSAVQSALPGSFIRDDTWNWTPGSILYVDTTAGGITATAPSGADDVVRVVGYAVTADVIYFNPEPGYITVTG